jgi:hypothetical protein
VVACGVVVGRDDAAAVRSARTAWLLRKVDDAASTPTSAGGDIRHWWRIISHCLILLRELVLYNSMYSQVLIENSDPPS